MLQVPGAAYSPHAGGAADGRAAGAIQRPLLSNVRPALAQQQRQPRDAAAAAFGRCRATREPAAHAQVCAADERNCRD